MRDIVLEFRHSLFLAFRAIGNFFLSFQEYFVLLVPLSVVFFVLMLRSDDVSHKFLWMCLFCFSFLIGMFSFLLL